MNGIPNLHLWLLPILPLAGFLVNGLFGRRFPKALVSAVAILATAIPVIQVATIVARFGSLTLPHVERSRLAAFTLTLSSSSTSSRW